MRYREDVELAVKPPHPKTQRVHGAAAPYLSGPHSFVAQRIFPIEAGETREVTVVAAEGGAVFHRVDSQGGIGGQRARHAGALHQVENLGRMSASNSYTGATTVSGGRLVVDGSINNSTVTVNSGGTLSLANENAAGSGRIIQTALDSLVEFLGGGRMTNEMSVFQYSFDENFEAAGQVTLADAASSMAVAAGRTLTGSGSFVGTGGLTKLGSGSLALTASNSFSGPLSVAAGTLQLGSASGAAAGAVASIAVSSGATLLVSQNNQVNNAASVTLSGGTIRTASGVSEVFGNLSVTGSGFLDFGTTSYANANTISFGTYTYTNTPSALLTINNFNFGSTMTFGSNLNGDDLATFAFTNGGIASSSWNGSTFTITLLGHGYGAARNCGMPDYSCLS